METTNPRARRAARAARSATTSDRKRSIGERRLSLALEAAGLGAWELDARLRRSTWSLRAREILGLPINGRVSARQIAARVHGDDRARFSASWKAAATPGDHACEFRVLRPGGTARWVSLRWRTLVGRNGGNGGAAAPGLRVGTVLDITPGRSAEEALRSSRSLLDEAQRIAHLGAFEWDVPSRRALWTDEVFRIVGLEPGAVQPTVETMLDHTHPDDREELARLVERCFLTGEPFSRRFRVVRPDGSGRVALRQGRMVRGPTGVPLRIVGTVQDVTAESREEEERHENHTRDLRARSLESLAVLSGGIAHNFNNLLCALLGHVELAFAALPGSSPVRDDLELAMKAGHRAADLSAQMLACSGRARIVVAPVDLNELVDALGGQLRASAPKSAALELELDAELPRIVADVTQIRQLVTNLVLNASESLPPAGGTIRVRTRRIRVDAAFRAAQTEPERIAEGPHVCLEVTDDGQGMDAATESRMFEPFFTTRFTGRGLGLAVVHGIVRAHGGAVQVDSALGRGTTVQVVLPVAAPDHGDVSDVELPAPASAPASAPAESLPQGAEGRLILVIDDEEMVRTVTRLMLEQHGFRVVDAAEGGAGLRVFHQRRDEIHAVVLDLTMPVMGGKAVLAEIRRIAPATPVLLSSGYDERDVADLLGGMGMTGFLAKPYDSAHLIAALRAVVERSRRA